MTNEASVPQRSLYFFTPVEDFESYDCELIDHTMAKNKKMLHRLFVEYSFNGSYRAKTLDV